MSRCSCVRPSRPHRRSGTGGKLNSGLRRALDTCYFFFIPTSRLMMAISSFMIAGTETKTHQNQGSSRVWFCFQHALIKSCHIKCRKLKDAYQFLADMEVGGKQIDLQPNTGPVVVDHCLRPQQISLTLLEEKPLSCTSWSKDIC